MEMQLYNQEAQEVGKISLSDKIFGLPMNSDLLYQVVTAQRSNQRRVIAHAKGRSEVRGGGKKPWRQKGTGRARHGSIRSPIWKGGGVTHGPTKERNFKKIINRKAARKALRIALSAKARDNNIAVIDSINLRNSKTKEMAEIMKKLSAVFVQNKAKNSSMLLVLPVKNEQVQRFTNNIAHVYVAEARNLNALEILSYKNLVFLKDSLDVLEKNLKLNHVTHSR